MVWFPAIFLGIWLLVSLYKRGVTVASLMILLYFVTSVFSIMLDKNNLYQYNVINMGVGFFPPIIYCVLLWLCISPFQIARESSISKVEVYNPKILDYCTYFYFAIFAIIVLVAGTNMREILVGGAIAEVRQQSYSDDAVSFYDHLSGIPRYICALTTYFLASSYIMILVFMYNVITERKGFVFNMIALCGSLPQLLTSVMQADRSQFVYWVIMFLFSLLLFKNMINKKVAKRLLTYIAPLFVVLIIYFLIVTFSRWGDSESGTMDGTIIYAGQNFINFCTNIQICWSTPISLCEIFPLTYHILGLENYFDWCKVVEKSSGVFMANFSTFLGLICSVSGPIIMFIYVFIYRAVQKQFLRRRSINIITFYEILKYWIVASVPLLGIFGHFYMGYASSIALIIWMLVGKLSNKRYKLTFKH